MDENRIVISNKFDVILQCSVIFKYLFYRYNMNDRDLRTKKHSLVSLKNTQEKTINNSYIKLGPSCAPKQPPNISMHYLEVTKKKQAQSRQLRHKQYEPQIFYYEVEKQKSKIIMNPRPPRTSYSKNQQQTKLKKTKRDIHHISKPHKLKPKLQSRQNKQPRSIIVECEQIKKQKMSRTDAGLIECTNINFNLSCKQKLMKKLKNNLKPMSCDLNRPSHQKLASQHHVHHVPVKSFSQQMAEFEAKNTQFQIEAETQALSQLFYKQKSYSRVQNYNCYLRKNQPNIDWKKRAIIMNWMMQILSELNSKRQVFALAVNYMDRYLALTQNLPLQHLQLLACGALSLSNKMEGLTFSIDSLHETIAEQFSRTQILQFQQKLACTLKWKLNPPTANMWANRISKHWDLYLDHNASNLPTSMRQKLDKIKFKSQDTNGYHNFRSLMQYIDVAILDIHTLQYHNRELAASFIYIVLNIELEIYTVEQIINLFPVSSQYLIKQNDLNDFFCEFLQHSFGFLLQDLLPTVQYCSTFLILPLCFKLPEGIDQNMGQGQEQQSKMTFSQFCSFQTYNSRNCITLTNRNRQFD